MPKKVQTPDAHESHEQYDQPKKISAQTQKHIMMIRKNAIYAEGSALFLMLGTRVGAWESAFSSSLLHTEFTALLKNPVKRELLFSMRSALTPAARRQRDERKRQVALHIWTVRKLSNFEIR